MVEVYDDVQDIWVPVATQFLRPGQEFRFTDNRARSFIAKEFPVEKDGSWLVQCNKEKHRGREAN